MHILPTLLGIWNAGTFVLPLSAIFQYGKARGIDKMAVKGLDRCVN